MNINRFPGRIISRRWNFHYFIVHASALSYDKSQTSTVNNTTNTRCVTATSQLISGEVTAPIYELFLYEHPSMPSTTPGCLSHAYRSEALVNNCRI